MKLRSLFVELVLAAVCILFATLGAVADRAVAAEEPAVLEPAQAPPPSPPPGP